MMAMFLRMLTICSCLAMASAAWLSIAPWTKTVARTVKRISARQAQRTRKPSSRPRPPSTSKRIASVTHRPGAGQPRLARKPLMPATPVIFMKPERMKMADSSRREIHERCAFICVSSWSDGLLGTGYVSNLTPRAAGRAEAAGEGPPPEGRRPAPSLACLAVDLLADPGKLAAVLLRHPCGEVTLHLHEPRADRLQQLQACRGDAADRQPPVPL